MYHQGYIRPSQGLHGSRNGNTNLFGISFNSINSKYESMFIIYIQSDINRPHYKYLHTYHIQKQTSNKMFLVMWQTNAVDIPGLLMCPLMSRLILRLRSRRRVAPPAVAVPLDPDLLLRSFSTKLSTDAK